MYAQAGQDVEALKVCPEGKYYVDIGSAHPHHFNNTYLLEQHGWSGMLIDIDVAAMNLCKDMRGSNNSYVNADLSKTSIGTIFDALSSPPIIDFISFDVDEVNEQVVQKFPFDKYKFRFATIEHDLYHRGPHLKDYIKDVFTANGYTMYKENVIAPGHGEYEDWYVDTQLINSDLLI
tara:strand:+ start:219 stop:749 length:531 start_codon:yes stop_codon:yes gene_type:complete